MSLNFHMYTQHFENAYFFDNRYPRLCCYSLIKYYVCQTTKVLTRLYLASLLFIMHGTFFLWKDWLDLKSQIISVCCWHFCVLFTLLPSTKIIKIRKVHITHRTRITKCQNLNNVILITWKNLNSLTTKRVFKIYSSSQDRHFI